MRKALIALALIAIVSLVIAGCNKELVPAGVVQGNKEPAPKETVQGSNEPSVTVASSSTAGDSPITGSLNQVYSLDSELSDPELDKTGDYIDEIGW
jgi:PBP1b-binding outer membrane lipoprotein LpoB